MIADLKPYPAYKDSGSNWLAQVPTHWEVRNLRTLIRPSNERNRVDLPLLSVARERGVFVRSMTDASENHNIIPLDLTNYKVARTGSLVINKMKAWQGSMGIAPCDGIVSPAYYVFDFDIADRRFGQTLLRSKPYVAHFGQASDGVRVGQWDLTIAAMRQIPVLAPPPEEQAAIVKFLDWANARLERTIRAKRRVIALLTEQKQAIIHRAVTRGLDPTVPLKPSGIAWLGDIPAHWENLPIKRCSSVISKGTTPSTEGREVLLEGTIRFLKAENISGGLIVDKPIVFIDEVTHAMLGRSQLKQHDVLFVIAGATLGKTAIVSEAHVPCNTNQAVAFIRPNRKVMSEFLSLWLQSPRIKEQIWLNAVQSAQPNLSMGSLGMFQTPLPPLEEQALIVTSLRFETGKFSSAISRLEREIDLLREYRTRLVADVVTGKLDVREAAARLPQEEVETILEPEALDPMDASDAEAELEA